MKRTPTSSAAERAAVALACSAALLCLADAGLAAPRGKTPELPPAPVSVRVIAPSPDPPWTLEVVNEGDRPVRIPADVRLLTMELQRSGKRERIPCRPAPGQKPSRFPMARELVLAPGESWSEAFDPRLFCFDRAGDLLRGGTIIRSSFGFGKPRGRAGEPFVVQSLDAPASFAPARELDAPTLLLSYAPSELTPPEPLPTGASLANAPLEAPPPPPATPATEQAASKTTEKEARLAEKKAKAERLEQEAAARRAADHEKELRTTYAEPETPAPVRDRQAADLDLYTYPWSDGGAPRDLVLRLHARNEGGRALAAVLRSRMLRFRVEGPLLSDNRNAITAECIVDERSHGVPVEMVRSYRPGDRLDIPFLLAEVCPAGTFDRPGLFRVTPVLTAAITGEAVEHREAFQGRIRALQPVLARVGSSRLPFYEDMARATPATPPPGAEHAAPEGDAEVSTDGSATGAEGTETVPQDAR